MYPGEAGSARAFMNSPSVCRSVSPVCFSDAEANG
jgi:hypothetical protein